MALGAGDGWVGELAMMTQFMIWLRELLATRGVLDATSAAWVAQGIGGAWVVLLAWAGNLLAKRVIVRSMREIVKRTPFKWDDVLAEKRVFNRLSHLVPAIIINALADDVLGGSEQAKAWVGDAVNVYLIVIWLGVLFALLGALQIGLERSASKQGLPVKGFVQAVKLVATVVSGVFALAIFLDKSPVYVFSGLGAATAVSLLIFRDAILGFAAGIMISVNDIVRVGDWIEMPKAGADGDVIDVSLTTVKVQNWDRTVTTIPTYNLISDSFKNWRGMQESGGRRIKRAIHIDLGTIRFADEEQLARWSKIGHVREHLARKGEEIAADNVKLGDEAAVLGNGRRLTNVGTFRAYVVSYLRANPSISQNHTFLVRQLEPGPQGLPIEIYVFVNNTAWAFYEGVQADVFDHLLAVLGVFDLRVFQGPSGADVRGAAEVLRVAAASGGRESGEGGEEA